MKILAVAAIDMGGFLAESAPVVKEGRGKDKITYILLTSTQRDKLARSFIERVDYEFQGKFPEALPPGFESLENKRADHWHNGNNQWVNAHSLYEFLDKRYDKEDATYGAVLMFQLIKKAMEL